MFVSNAIGIVADDLTGANDTALQFFLKGCNTQIILDENADYEHISLTQGWAISTESRNIPSDEARERVQKVCEIFSEKLNIEFYYKKIDSTLRGNIAVEILEMLDATGKECAVIAPAFPAEGRVTVGGYQLLRGIPIERTEMARDPHSPIYESYIPTILEQQLGKERRDLIGLIELQTVIKGAGPIVMRLNELIDEGKKLIVVDGVSSEDMGQIALASQKCTHEILPCGSAGFANALGNIWLGDLKNQHIQKTIPRMPKLILSGSATELTASQIKKLANDDDTTSYFVGLKTGTVLNGLSTEFTERILSNLKDDNIVCVHASSIIKELEEHPDILINASITKDALACIITDFLADLAKKIVCKKDVILITIGGETSYKCASATDSKSLHVVDAAAPSIPLCINANGQWIVTKSGNLGISTTLVDIMKYFERHE